MVRPASRSMFTAGAAGRAQTNYKCKVMARLHVGKERLDLLMFAHFTILYLICIKNIFKNYYFFVHFGHKLKIHTVCNVDHTTVKLHLFLVNRSHEQCHACDSESMHMALPLKLLSLEGIPHYISTFHILINIENSI